MAFEFISAHDDRANFTCEIPTPEGKTKLFRVPLLAFIPEDVYRTYRQWSEENTDEKLIEKGERPIKVHFDELMRLLKPKDHQWFIDHLVYGEKAQLWTEWMAHPLHLGESTASSTA